MKQLIRLFVSLLVPAFMLAGLAASTAIAQDKAKAAKAEKGKATIKALFENDKVRVVESTFKPGDEGPNVARPFRVVRPLQGGTLTRIWPGGKKDTEVFKTGETQAQEAATAFVPKNEGKSDIVLFIVFVKEPKKM